MARATASNRAEWLEARQALMQREKAATRLRDELAAARMALPRLPVEKDYRFATAAGECGLDGLFDGRSQLVVYHFMLAPGWTAGCDGCSFLADHLDGTLVHLNHHDVTVTAVSRAPLPEIEAYRRRMGWRFPWASSHGSDFNYDHHVSFTEAQRQGEVFYNFTWMEGAQVGEEMPGLSCFERDPDGRIFHTYSAYARGPEDLITTYMILDLAPKGRNEEGVMDWMRRHDEYDTAAATACHGTAAE